MTTNYDSLASLTDQQLLAQVEVFAASERRATADLLASLAELDARRLYLGEGFPSLFNYCTQALHLSEHAAYNRIEAARAARKWPAIFQMIADGLVTLTAVRLLAPSMTDVNHRELLEVATHKTKREVEQIVAALHPQPAVPSIIRRLPAPKPAATGGSAIDCQQLATQPMAPVQTAEPGPAPTSLPPRRPAVIAPLTPERYKIQMTVSRETHDKLRRVQDLLRHQVPDGDPAMVFDRALTLLLQDLERRKLAAVSHPKLPRGSKSGSRHVPAAIRREVWKRDAGRCAFVGSGGRRCAERGFLEFHHVVPFADGGPTTTENLQLRCRAHNLYEAEEHFGPLLVREDRAAYSSFRNECGPPRDHVRSGASRPNAAEMPLRDRCSTINGVRFSARIGLACPPSALAPSPRSDTRCGAPSPATRTTAPVRWLATPTMYYRAIPVSVSPPVAHFSACLRQWDALRCKAAMPSHYAGGDTDS